MPRVSICIPVYNGRPYVAETIASVRAQSFKDWELVITENGSSDGSHEFIEDLLARTPDPARPLPPLFRRDGLAGSWNRTIQDASGELLKLLPCDDRLDPDCLSRQVLALDGRPDVGFVICSRRIC